MTLTLILTRHAKSDWQNPGLDDHDRPLNARGRAAAPRMGQWAASLAQPSQALVSTACRAAQTFQAMAPAFTSPPAALFLADLYHASPDTMARILRQATADCVLMVGHNPGIAAFAAALLQQLPDAPGFHRYPTAATLIASFPIDDWTDLRLGTGTALQFATPRTLDAGPASVDKR